jgi:hypothetical protein
MQQKIVTTQRWPSAQRSLFQDIEAHSSPPLSPRLMMSSDPFDLRSSNQRLSLSSAVFPHQSRGHRHFFTGTSTQFRGEPDMPMPMTNNGLQMQYQSVSHEFVYFCLLLFTFVYFCLLLFTFVYFCLLLFTFVYFCNLHVKYCLFFQVIECNKRLSPLNVGLLLKEVFFKTSRPSPRHYCHRGR